MYSGQSENSLQSFAQTLLHLAQEYYSVHQAASNRNTIHCILANSSTSICIVRKLDNNNKALRDRPIRRTNSGLSSCMDILMSWIRLLHHHLSSKMKFKKRYPTLFQKRRKIFLDAVYLLHLMIYILLLSYFQRNIQNGNQYLSDDTLFHFDLKVDYEMQGKNFLNIYLKLNTLKNKSEWQSLAR